MRLFAGILQAPETSSNLSRCLHTAEVAGSKPASPIPQSSDLSRRCKSVVRKRRASAATVGSKTTTYPVGSRDRRLVGYGEATRSLHQAVTASKSRTLEPHRTPPCATVRVVRGFLLLRV